MPSDGRHCHPDTDGFWTSHPIGSWTLISTGFDQSGYLGKAPRWMSRKGWASAEARFSGREGRLAQSTGD